MAETISGNWQSMGSTLKDEYKFVTHLQTPSLLQRQKSLRRHNSVLVDRSNSGGASLKRQNAMKLTLKAKVKRFLNRLSFKRRAQKYIYPKRFLQRQPSLVITPDLSSFSYHFTNKDLVKRKPKAHYKRTSVPIQTWKHAKPMNLLEPQPPTAQAPKATHNNSNTDSNTSQPNVIKDLSSSTSEEDKAARNWVRISLPLKARRNQFNGEFGFQDIDYEEAKQAMEGKANKVNKGDVSKEVKEEVKEVSNGDNVGVKDVGNVSDVKDAPKDAPKAVKDTLKDPSSEPSESQTPSVPAPTPAVTPKMDVSDTTPPSAESGKSKRSSWLTQIPQTPVQGFSSSTEKLPNQTPMAVTATPPESPTALPSNYRPESWRKSAILTRSSVKPDYLEEHQYVNTLAESWSTYIRQAVAQRAVNSKQRRSIELENEIRWSRNLAWDSEDESRRSLMSFETQSSSSGDRTPESMRHAFDSKPDLAYAVTNTDSQQSLSSRNVPSPTSSTQRLAPQHSPRAMANASVLALATSVSTRELRSSLASSRWQKESLSTNSLVASSIASSSLFDEDDNVFHNEPSFQLDSETAKLAAVAEAARALNGGSEDSFDFQLVSRKRALPKSPGSSTEMLPPVEINDLEPPSHTRNFSNNSTESMESASRIVRSQSRWRNSVNKSAKKRVKSGSNEHLLHSRQKTLESEWGEEDDDE